MSRRLAISATRSRRVVLHADDFGMNASVNAGIVQAFEDGLLTSASILPNAPAADEALAHAARLSEPGATAALLSRQRRVWLHDPDLPLDFGVHVNLTQGRPLSPDYPPELLDADGLFPGIGKLFFRLLLQPRRWRRAIARELGAQIAMVCDFGLRPTHLNGHQYVELLPAVATQIPELLRRFAIPVVRVAAEPGLRASMRLAGLPLHARLLTAVKRSYARYFGRRMWRAGVAFADAYFGSAHAGRIDGRVVGSFLQSATGCRLAEIAWHPGRRPADRPCPPLGWTDPLEHRRPAELALLSSPALVEMLSVAGFGLGRLSQLAGLSSRQPLAA